MKIETKVTVSGLNEDQIRELEDFLDTILVDYDTFESDGKVVIKDPNIIRISEIKVFTRRFK
jgi:stress response protein YsnF